MANFHHMFSLKTVCAVLMLNVFSLNAVKPIDHQFVITEGITLYKINKIKKMIKHFNPQTSLKDAIDMMLEIKSVANLQSTNIIFMKPSLNQAKDIMKSRGYKIDKTQWKALEKLIDSREKKFKSKLFFKNMAYDSGVNFDEDQFEIFYEKTYGKDNDNENIISLEVTLGVTFILCGIFMYTIPIPICATIGTGFIEAGCYFLGNEGWEHINEFVNN